MIQKESSILKAIREKGYDGRFTSVRHLKDLSTRVDALRIEYPEVVTSIGSSLDVFRFNVPDGFTEDAALFIFAVPQPVLRVYFEYHGEEQIALMPPTYLLNTSPENEVHHEVLKPIESFLRERFQLEGARFEKIHLPRKLLATMTGLAKYGRNNISYVEKMGSYFWLGAYITDLSISDDPWEKDQVLETCRDCAICTVSCPTNAIEESRFLVHAEKCLTYMNERSAEIPDWIKPSSHNALIGCLRCQLACPENRHAAAGILDSVHFTEVETLLLLEGCPLKDLSPDTVRKLHEINFVEEYDLLKRNLTLLLK